MRAFGVSERAQGGKGRSLPVGQEFHIPAVAFVFFVDFRPIAISVPGINNSNPLYTVASSGEVQKLRTLPPHSPG